MKEKESELRQLETIYDNMLTYAEINIRNRPCISSFDNRNRPVSFLVIPTLEDLKSFLFEPGDLVQEVGYPLKVTPPGTLGSPDRIPALVSMITQTIKKHLHDFNKECISHGGTTKIFDADGLTELSQDGLLKKYYPE